MARIPEPQPTSRTRAPPSAPRSASASTAARHSRVVGWRPVPNAIPGIEREDDVVGRAPVAAPRRPDDQPPADAHDREVRLPGLGPVRLVDDAASAARRSVAARTPAGARARRRPRRPPGRPRRGRAPGTYARTVAGRVGSTRAPRPSSTSSNAGSTEVPPGATRPRISLTASTASTSASTESSSQAPGPSRRLRRRRSLTRARASRAARRRRAPTDSPASSAYASSSSRCLLRELGRHDHVDHHVEVAALAGPPQVRHALAAQPDLGVRLGARP